MVLMGVFGYPRHDGTVSFAPRSAAIARWALSPFLAFSIWGVLPGASFRHFPGTIEDN